jgi:hypothetical protein
MMWMRLKDYVYILAIEEGSPTHGVPLAGILKI